MYGDLAYENYCGFGRPATRWMDWRGANEGLCWVFEDIKRRYTS